MNDLDHRDVLERLSAHLDDELDPVTSAAVSAHLAACASCTRAAERLRGLRTALRSELETHAAPDRLRERIAAATAAPGVAPMRLPPARAMRPRVRPSWGALAAALVAVAAVSWAVYERTAVAPAEALAGEVVSGHVRSLMAGHLMDVASSDRHTVKPWFDGRLDFAPPVEDLAASGFPLLGGRLDYLGARAVAALVYGRRRHVINLFLWPRSGSQPARALTRRGYHAVHGVAGGMEYWAVSDLDPAELAGFVDSLGFGAPAR